MNKPQNRFITPGKERLIKASALNPVNSGLKLLINTVGQNGKYEHPFDKELTKKWAKAREDYKMAYVSNQNFKMGSIVESAVSSDCWIAQLVVRDKEDKLDEKGLETAVKNLARLAKAEQASIHCSSKLFEALPRLKELVLEEVVSQGTNLYVYDA